MGQTNGGGRWLWRRVRGVGDANAWPLARIIFFGLRDGVGVIRTHGTVRLLRPCSVGACDCHALAGPAARGLSGFRERGAVIA